MTVLEGGRITRVYTRGEALSLGDDEMRRRGLRTFSAPVFSGSMVCECASSSLKLDEVYSRLGNRHVLAGAPLSLSAGHVLALTGSNGAGKTTLCRIVCGLMRESAGAVCYRGMPTKRKHRVRRSSCVQQDADYQLYASTVREELLIGASEKKSYKAQVDDLLERFGLASYEHRHPASLSGGQKQRLLLAVACMRKERILVLDEPTSGLDGMHMTAVADQLKELARQEWSILVITHDRDLIDVSADEVAYLEKGTTSYELSVAHTV